MARTLVALLIASLALPTAAQAQRAGVFVDPESPAGREYAIPLEEARRRGAAGDERAGSQGRPGAQPLFGEGIQRAPSASAAPGRSSGDRELGGVDGESGASGRNTGANGGKSGAAEAGGTDETVRDRGSSVAVEAAASGGSDALITAGIGGTVLALGLLVGLGLRRLLRSE